MSHALVGQTDWAEVVAQFVHDTFEALRDVAHALIHVVSEDVLNRGREQV